MTWKGEKIDCRLKPGDVQRFTFQAGDPLPFYDVDAPPKNVKDSRRIRVRTPGEGPGFKFALGTVVGYEGKPKGLRQVLWERGLWQEGMTSNADPTSGLNLYTSHGRLLGFLREFCASAFS